MNKNTLSLPSFDVPIIGSQPKNITYDELKKAFADWKANNKIIELAKDHHPLFPLVLVEFFGIARRTSITSIDVSKPLIYDIFYPFVKLLRPIIVKDIEYPAGTIYKTLSSFFDDVIIPPDPALGQPKLTDLEPMKRMDLKHYLYRLDYSETKEPIDRNVRIISYNELTAIYEGSL